MTALLTIMAGFTAGPSFVAIALAAAAAFCFATAAVLQHRALTTKGTGAAAQVGLGARIRTRGWLSGLAAAATGTALHVIALTLAPLAVVQPIGVLAVPIAVLLGAVRSGRRPSTGALAGVGLCLAGVAAFVSTASTAAAVAATTTVGATLVSGAVAATAVAVLAALGSARSGRARSLLCAIAGAVAFGVVSSLMRAIAVAVATGSSLLAPALLASGAAMAVAFVVGGWLVQQAFTAGSPAVVVACLTVVDPIVAVLLGAVFLGEDPVTTATAWLRLVAAATTAAAGVIALAGHHPDALAQRERPTRRPGSSRGYRLFTPPLEGTFL